MTRLSGQIASARATIMAWLMPQPPKPSDSAVPPTGDAAAWMLEYGPALRSYFRKRVGAVEAEDLVQDVFVALQERATLDNVEHLGRYVFGIAAKVLAKRGSPLTLEMPEAEGLDHLVALIDDLSPERALIAKDTLSKLVAALSTLPPRSAQAFILHRFEEMSYGEIAAHMKIGVRTVESHVERTVGRLLTILGGR